LGLSATLIRLSPGCETAQDLVDDLTEGLRELEVARGTKQGATAAAR